MSLRPIFRYSRGFTMVAAIFILVVLAALGAAMVNISTGQQIGAAYDVQGALAYQAARTGIEWSAYQLQSTPAYNFGHGGANPNTRICPASTSFTPTAPTLAGFTISVSCTSYSDGATSGPTVYVITSTACNRTACAASGTNPGSNYVERQLVAAF